jgi:hypothetical protein
MPGAVDIDRGDTWSRTSVRLRRRATTRSSGSHVSKTMPKARNFRSCGTARSTRSRIDEADWSKLTKGEFDPVKSFAAYYRTLRWNPVTSTDPTLFQAPYRAGIRLDAYQLEPLRKALLRSRVNLFIADDVGLGKTIEAGLIIRELLMRQRVETGI